MNKFSLQDLKKLSVLSSSSHKGDNGKLLLIGGSSLFHGASLWSLKVASRIVDMVFYSSVPENNEIVQKAKEEFRDGIVVLRDDIEAYASEADCILIGPGMMRSQAVHGSELTVDNLQEINRLEDEGLQARYLVQYLLTKYSHKKWVIDAGALQMMDAAWFDKTEGNVLITPHAKEFEGLFKVGPTDEFIQEQAKKHNCTILLKGEEDIICNRISCVKVIGGNAGMTKGGTGDVLAGLVAALACTNDLFLSATAGSYINKKAGDELYKRVGPYFNASDLADEIPVVMKELLL